MGFLDKLFRRKGTAIDTSAALVEELGVTYDSISGRRVSSHQAMRLTTVFGCVRVLSESVGMLPCRLMEQGERTKLPATNHSLYRLLNVAPNDFMTAQEFWELVVACLCLRGNFYAYKVKGLGNRVSELLPLDPGTVEAKLDNNWNPVYRVTFPNGTVDVLGQDKVWHIRGMSLDGFNGLNPVAYAREAIALGLDTEEHGSQLFRNGAVTTGVLQTEQTLSDTAYKRLKDDFKERHGGLANNHKPMILEGGLNWKPISLNAEDSQFLETRKYQRDEICAIFRVPPHLVANMERATFSNIEHQGLNFVNYSLVPYLTRIEHRVQVGLLERSDQAKYFAKFNTGALLRGDMKARFEAYAIGINWGMYSPNDCLELEDRNPREGGDVYLTPMNMTTKPEAASNDKE